MSQRTFSTTAGGSGTINGVTVPLTTNPFSVTVADVAMTLIADRSLWVDFNPLEYTATVTNDSTDYPYELDSFAIGDFDDSVRYSANSFTVNGVPVDDSQVVTQNDRISVTFNAAQAIATSSTPLVIKFSIEKIFP